MSLSSIGSTTSLAASQLVPLSSTSRIQPSDNDDGPPPAPPGISRFASAISDAFASIGISFDGTSSPSTAAATSTTAADATATDGTGESDALGAFLQSLLAALQGQSTVASPSSDDPPSDPSQSQQSTTVDASAGATRGDGVAHAHREHGGKLEADLQSLISELQSSTDSTSTDAGTTTGTATSSETALATLEKQFDALVATSGTSSTDSSGSLSTFLQSLASHLHGAPATGNIVSTQA